MNIDTQIESLLDILEFLLNQLNVANIADLKEILEETINEVLTIKNNLTDCKFKEIGKDRENDNTEDIFNDNGDNSSDLNHKEDEENFDINGKENENSDDYEIKLEKEEPEKKHVVLNHHLQTVQSVVKIGIKSGNNSEHGVRKRCKICSFDYRGDTAEHIHDNHMVNGKYSCSKCDFISNDENSLIEHSKAHKISPLYVCPNGACSKSFKKVVGEKGFLNHMEDEHDYRTEDLLCPICNVKKQSKSPLIHHIQKVHNQNLDLQCKKCLKTFITPQTYVKHMKRYHGNVQTLKCQECGYSTKFEKFMKAHKLKKHSHASVEKVFQTNCEFCGMRLPYKERQKHVADHHVVDGKYLCPTCNFVSEDESGLREHCNNEHNDKAKVALFLCPEIDCNNESFQSVEMLLNHMVKEHNFPLEELKCPICYKKKTKKKTLVNHIYSVHSNADNQCKKCFQEFANRNSLRAHMITQHSNLAQTYTCDQCGFTTKIKKTMTLHILRHHSLGEKNFCCPECPKKFYLETQMKEHIRIYHVQEKFMCSQCDFSSTLKGNLTKHIEAVHGSQERKFPCDICGKLFRTTSEAKSHIRLTHNAEKNFKCNHCERAFATNYKLKRHVAIHEGKYEGHCESCSKSFVQFINYKLHMMKHHQVEVIHPSKLKTVK